VQEYCSAESDPLRGSAAALAGHLNAERGEDVLRIAAEAVGSRFEALAGAQLLCASFAVARSLGPCLQSCRLAVWRTIRDDFCSSQACRLVKALGCSVACSEDVSIVRGCT